MEAVKATGIGHEQRAFRLKHLPHGPVCHLWVRIGLGPGDALVDQKRVQLLEALHPQARREEALADGADLALDLSPSPAVSNRWRHAGSTQPDAGVQATGSTR